MRSSLQALAAVLLATTFAAPVIAATPGGATQETLSGVLEAVHVDEFATGRERERYLLRTPGGVMPLEFADGGPDGYGGAMVTVTGTRVGRALRIESSRAGRSFRVTRAPRAGETATVEAMDGADGSSTARAPRTTYSYAVTAVDSTGHLGGPAMVTVTTTADTIRPSTPARFRRVARSGTYVTFAWSASSDNVRVVRYHVYRYGRSTPVARTTGTKIRIYTVYGARYYVRAVDAAGNKSPRSAIVRGR